MLKGNLLVSKESWQITLLERNFKTMIFFLAVIDILFYNYTIAILLDI